MFAQAGPVLIHLKKNKTKGKKLKTNVRFSLYIENSNFASKPTDEEKNTATTTEKKI